MTRTLILSLFFATIGCHSEPVHRSLLDHNADGHPVPSYGDTGTPTETEQDYTLIRTESLPTIWRVEDNGDRRTFTEDQIFYTWEETMNIVLTVTEEEVTTLPLVGNMPAKPGVVLVKITSDTTVFWVQDVEGEPFDPVLRPIADEATAVALIGSNWADYVIDIPDPFFVDYTVDWNDPVTIDNFMDVGADMDVMKRREDLHE